MPEHWLKIRDESFLAAPRLLAHTMASLSAIYQEMSLPLDQRAGTRATANPAPKSAAPHPSNEDILAKALQKHRHKQYLTVSDLKPHVNSRFRTEAQYKAIFQVAERLSVGVIEGEFPGTRANPYRLKLTREKILAETRIRLGLEADMGDVVEAGASKHAHCPNQMLDFGEFFLRALRFLCGAAPLTGALPQ